jgi:hypothetical protein
MVWGREAITSATRLGFAFSIPNMFAILAKESLIVPGPGKKLSESLLVANDIELYLERSAPRTLQLELHGSVFGFGKKQLPRFAEVSLRHADPS